LVNENDFFKVPEGCTKDECSYICEEFITPNGLNIDEIFNTENLAVNTKSAEANGFLSMISNDLKIIYSKSKDSIDPTDFKSALDTSTLKTQEKVIMTELEKKFRDVKPVSLMINESSEEPEDITVQVDNMEFV